MGGVCNKQGSTDSGKWRSLAGLLPGGGLKWTPPGHQSSLFHPPGVGRSDRRRWAPESLDVREEATYGCSMVLACGQIFTLEASEARAPHSRHTSNSTTTEHATVQCTEAALPTQCEGRDELEHLSQACGGAMNSSTSHRRAWHQPWACDDCRPLGLARLCFIASRLVPAPSRRLILCASGKTGGWEPRGVPLAHVLPNVALMQ